MKSRSPAALLFVLTLTAGWSLSGACGGRSLSTTHPDGGGAGQATGSAGDGGGTTGTAGGTTTGSGGSGTGSGGSGTGSAGAGTGSAGAGTGSAGTGAGGVGGATGSGAAGGHAGTTGQGGAGGAGCGLCPPTNCKDGFMAVVDPAVSCCAICRPINCATVDCANPQCEPGFHTEVPAGKCCPVCVKGLSEACNKAQAYYSSSRQQFLEKYGASPCNVDADCEIVFEHNACVTNCGEALPVSTAGFFESGIQSFADACDASCPPLPLPPCAAFVAVCSNGLCVTASGPGH